MRAILTALLAGAIVAPACARVGSLPGGPEDRAGPRLLETVPEALHVGPLDGPVVFRFDERLSEQGVANAVRVSPATGEVRVERNGNELRVSLEGGWRPDQVYHVTVAPTLKDLFQNTRTARTELVFSTGPQIQETALAGQLLDRVTGREAEGAYLMALRRVDNTAYVAAADSVGFAALRYVPFGVYEVRAFVDRNNDGVPDPLEDASAPVMVSLSENADTSVMVYRILPGDTTPARLMRAQPVDSLFVRLAFDDLLDPEQELAVVEAELLALPDSTSVVRVLALLHGGPFEATRKARADSARAVREDSIFRARVDSVAAVNPDSAAALLRADSAQRAVRADLPAPAAAADSVPAPVRELILGVSPPLPPGAEYLVRLSNVRNLTGIPGGGGEAVLEIPERPDTAAVPGTAASPPPPDTAASATPLRTPASATPPGTTVPGGRPAPVAPASRGRPPV